MKTLYGFATGLALLVGAGCADGAPTEPAVPVMTEARFAELRDAAIRITERIDAAGEMTAEDRIEIEAISRELDACVEAGGRSLATEAAAAPGSTTASPIYGGSPGGGSCLPCPFILSHGNCIGVLRSQGPCRPGAGLERCFYTWYCYGSTG
jgi:hypothetical protein